MHLVEIGAGTISTVNRCDINIRHEHNKQNNDDIETYCHLSAHKICIHRGINNVEQINYDGHNHDQNTAQQEQNQAEFPEDLQHLGVHTHIHGANVTEVGQNQRHDQRTAGHTEGEARSIVTCRGKRDLDRAEKLVMKSGAYSNPAQNLGRITRNAVLAMKADVNLWRAAFATYYAGTEYKLVNKEGTMYVNPADVQAYYNACIENCNAVIKNMDDALEEDRKGGNKFNELYSEKELLELAVSKKWNQYDQDLLNYICKDDVKIIDAEWDFVEDIFDIYHSMPEKLLKEFIASEKNVENFKYYEKSYYYWCYVGIRARNRS